MKKTLRAPVKVAQIASTVLSGIKYQDNRIIVKAKENGVEGSLFLMKSLKSNETYPVVIGDGCYFDPSEKICKKLYVTESSFGKIVSTHAYWAVVADTNDPDCHVLGTYTTGDNTVDIRGTYASLRLFPEDTMLVSALSLKDEAKKKRISCYVLKCGESDDWYFQILHVQGRPEFTVSEKHNIVVPMGYYVDNCSKDVVPYLIGCVAEDIT